MECQPRLRSLQLYVGGADHLAPLLGFGREVLSEIGRRAGERNGTELRKPSLELGIGAEFPPRYRRFARHLHRVDTVKAVRRQKKITFQIAWK